MKCLDSYGETLYYFTQWDMNQKLYIADSMLTEAPMVHFQNKNTKKAFVVQSSIGNDGTVSADVPNRLLAEPYPIGIYVYATKGDSSKSVWHTTIPVRRRAMPEGFLYNGDTGVLDMSEELKKLEETIKNMQSQIEEISGMLEGNVVVDKDDEPPTPGNPDEQVPEGFWGGTVDIYVDATSDNTSGGETIEDALMPNNIYAQEVIRNLADSAQNVNIHIVKSPDGSTVAVPLDLMVKHDRTVTFDFMEGCGNGVCRDSDMYKNGSIISDVTFPLRGEYTDCTIRSNDDWDNGFDTNANSFPVFRSCRIETKGDLRLAQPWSGVDFSENVTLCDDCEIICGGNFRFHQSKKDSPYVIMQNSTLTVKGDWYIWGYGGNRVSPYLFNSCTANIHEVKIDRTHTGSNGLFDGTGSEITIETIGHTNGLSDKYMSVGAQDFTLPSEWKTRISSGEAKLEIYNTNVQKVADAKKVAASVVNGMTVTDGTTPDSIKLLIKNAIEGAGITGITVTVTYNIGEYGDGTRYLSGSASISVNDISDSVTIYKLVS